MKGDVIRSGQDEVRVNMPFLVQDGGNLVVGWNNEPTLNIDSLGNAATDDNSLLVQAGGIVSLEQVTLRVARWAKFDGGQRYIGSGGVAEVRANQVIFSGNSELDLAYDQTQSDSQLLFRVIGANAEVSLQSGTWKFDAVNANRYDRVTIFGGPLQIAQNNTTLEVKGWLNVQPADVYPIIQGNINGDFAQKTFIGQDFIRIPPLDRFYNLRPIQPGAGGMAWRDINDNGMPGFIGSPFPLPSGATLTMNADGTFVYIPAHGFAGLDSFTYTVDDGFYLATAKVYIDVTNDPPDAQDDYYYTEQWQTLNVSALFGLLANDSDMDGDPLFVF